MGLASHRSIVNGLKALVILMSNLDSCISVHLSVLPQDGSIYFDDLRFNKNTF